MGYKISFNPSQIKTKVDNPDLRLFAHTRLHAYCDEYVPFRTGRLSKDVSITVEGVLYKAPYAVDCYYNNWNFRKDYHPKATNKWDSYMWTEKQDSFMKEIEEYIKQRL